MHEMYDAVFDTFFDVPENEYQYMVQSFLGGLIPPLGSYYRARDNTNYMRDYMRNSGLSWSDIRYPTRTAGYSGYSGYGGLVSYVSKNIMRLYA
jgi:hypothetical protein